jgi:hypothetical protein
LAGALLFCASLACAQDETENAHLAELAREFNDPLTTLPQLLFQDVYAPANYGTKAQANGVIAGVGKFDIRNQLGKPRLSASPQR